MENVILFGVGVHIAEAVSAIREAREKIVAIVDNDAKKVGTLYEEYRIESPDIIAKMNYDRIVICTRLHFDEIVKQLTTQYHVAPHIISDYVYYSKVNLINYYKKNEHELNQDIIELLQYIKEHDELEVFNYSFTDKYKSVKIDSYFDEEKGLFYVDYYGKRMYLKRCYNTKDKVEAYARGLLTEQDDESPHKYVDDDFDVREGDVVLDAGAAEGNFSLQVIDKVKHLYLIETDGQWVEALQYTFEPYKDKVTIINKFLSKESGSDSVTIDEIAQGTVINFIKMDIEGAEIDALQGGLASLNKTDNQRIAVCAYHNFDDEREISSMLRQCGYSLSTTAGYMVFMATTAEPKKFVKGIVRGEK